MATPLPLRPPEINLARAIARAVNGTGTPGTSPVLTKPERSPDR